jgi:predicted ATPase
MTPVQVYRVLGESATQNRLDVAATRGLTPLVSREQEVGLLLERWAQAKEGLGQVVVLSGEAGIGKSRLVQVLKERLAGEPHRRWECHCSPYNQNSALYPVIDLMQRALQFARDDAPDEKLRKLEQTLSHPQVSLPDMVPLLASLLSVPLSGRYPPLTLTPQRQRQRTLEAVLAVLLALTAQQPLVFIVEDLHWVDPSTLELLTLLIDQGPTARILILLTYRPEFRPPWGFRAHLTVLTLSRLPRTQTAVMVDRVVGGKPLPPEVVQQVVAKTDGVPLFVEELTKMVLEAGLLQEREDHYELRGPLPPLAIPATLYDSLMARLDRLSTVKEIAQLAATLGRTFSYALLQAVSPLPEGTLQQALTRLVEAELLYQRGLPPQATYLFKHVLIQEAAYQSLLRSRRQQVHHRIAQVLEEQFPDTTQIQPELLAYHYTEAGLAAQAIPCWLRAGQRAIQHSANIEAIGHLTKGLEILKTLPDTSERTQQELDFQITLGPALMSTKGFTAPEVERTYMRAHELCQQVEEAPQLLPTLWGLWRFYAQRGELQTALELGKQILTLAQRVRDPALLLQGHHAVGPTLFYMGELASAHAHLAQGIALYDPQQHRSSLLYGGHDPGVCCQDYAAFTLWVLGYPDQAREQSDEALRLAQELAHPFTLGNALIFAALLHQFRREGQAAQAQAEAAVTLCREHGFEEWVVYGRILRGWALIAQRRAEEGIAQMYEGLRAWGTMGVELYRTYQLAQLAEAYGKVEQADQGLRVLGEALAVVHNTGRRFYQAELYRIKGELLLARAAEHHAEVETCFRQALDVARRQEAKSLELRAGMSLSRLWQQQGKRDEARKLLAPVYGWFTEGFDTADLQEAKALLNEWS